MSNLTSRFKKFEVRVRIVRSWRGMAIGACLGAGACAVWALLDWRGVLFTEWSWMGAVLGVSALAGLMAGALLRVPQAALAASIDRRAGLEDRLTTARERQGGEDSFDDALQMDAEEKILTLQPNKVFPIRFGRWHGGALVLTALAAMLFLLGNTPIMLGEDARKAQEELKKDGKTVERITKKNFETPEAKSEMSEAEKKLADEMRKYQRELEKAHITKEESLQKANELNEQAEKLAKMAAQSAQQSLAQAETIRGQMEKGELQKAGLNDLAAQMASMSAADRKEKLAQAKKEAKDIQKQLDELKKQLDAINKKLANPNLTPEERKKLEKEKSEIQKAISALEAKELENQAMQKALEMSQEARDIFKKMMDDPIYKQIMDLARKLEQDAESASQSGKGKMTDAEREALRKELEELAQKLKDPKAMKEYLDALLQAMLEAKRLGRCNGLSSGINGLLSMGLTSPPGPGAPTEDIWHGDSGKVYHLDKAAESKGKTTTSVISGQAREATGPQAYVEIKAPSLVGNRSSVPYQNVLPSYAKKAESALDRQQIPKEHQKRVKEYFESLTDSKKG